MEMSIKTERENTQKVYKMERVTGKWESTEDSDNAHSNSAHL